jgi:hypothetical protein
MSADVKVRFSSHVITFTYFISFALLFTHQETQTSSYVTIRLDLVLQPGIQPFG